MKGSKTLPTYFFRESNMELARIVAMFFVLLAHTNFLSLGWPTCNDSIISPYQTLFRLFVQSITIVCVDLFVLISGWYGIKPTIKKGMNILYTTLFYSFLVFIVFIIVQGKDAITIESIKNALLLNKGYWFIKCYLFLMIMAPTLNAFAEKATQSQFKALLIILLIFQSYFGWSDASFDYHHGFSSLLFIFLYLLARYVNMYQREYSFGARRYLFVYMAITVAMTLFTYVATRFEFIPSSLVWYSFNYLNPFVIVSALSLLLFFRNMKFHVKWVNWIASSVFAVYLVHSNEMVLPKYSGVVVELSKNKMPILSILVFIVIVFVGSILIDKIRQSLFLLIETKLKNK